MSARSTHTSLPSRTSLRAGASRTGTQLRVLGPIEVTNEGHPIALGGPKQRAVLAHLIIRANQVVPSDALIDLVWGEEPPDAVRTSLQSYVSNLRKALGSNRLEGRTPGYILHVEPAELDASRFELLLREARTVGDQPDRAAPQLREALELWRGPAYADLATEEPLAGEIARLNDLRLQALEERIEADITNGRHVEVLGELDALTHEHVLRERLWGHMILALYRSGRQADALAAYQRLRDVLAEELGVDPSRELQELHQQVLRQDESLQLRGESLRGYRLLEKVGEGAFGVVYRAIQPQVEREVAVKSIHAELANQPDFVRRFEREAQLVARLEHPHVVPLYDYWREPDAAYLIMRYLRGGNLEDLLHHGPLELERAASVLDQMSAALAAAHRQGVTHRDVKPGNILLDEEGNAYLSDFGIALETGAPEQTAGTMIRGTPAYLSPEQIRLEQTTPSSDIYALGIVLYEMLTAKHPFPGTSLNVLLDQHLHHPIPSVRNTRSEIPPAVDAAIGRATAKDPEARFPDVMELAAAFRTAVEGTGRRVVPAGEIRNPYKGLRAFLEADSADFFGREVLTRRLIERIAETGAPRFLCAVGPSGSGKSSAVRAGLVPAIRRGVIPGSDRWYVIEVLPGAHPMRELETALLGVSVEPPPSLLEDLERDEFGLARAVDRLLPDPEAELLIVLDQLEEIFTMVEDETERVHVLESIRVATADPASRIRVVATLRADFYDQPLSIRGFGDLLAARNEAITPMSPEELERAIVGPAERVGLDIERGLVAAMVSDVVDRPGALPLLQYALTELADRKDIGSLTLNAYRRIGGVSGALARRAEHLYDALDDAGRDACRQLFLQLVTLSEGAEDTRRRVRRSALTSSDRVATDPVIDAFGRHRLLSFDRDPASREPTVEIAHEALLGAWARLRTWIDGARDDLRTRTTVATSATEWQASGRDESFLLRGGRLEHMASWAETTSVALSPADDEYLEASLRRREEEAVAENERRTREVALERRSLRRARALVAVLTVAALIAGGLTVIATNQSGRAAREARIATARELAAAAVANLDVDPERSILLALRSVAISREIGPPLPEAVEALHRAIATDRLLFTIKHPSTGNVAYSPDGRLLATGGAIGGNEQTDVLLWDAQAGGLVHTLSGHSADVYSVAFSSDGSRLVTTADDDLTIVWDTQSGERLLTVPGEQDEASGASFSPDGHLLAIGSRRRKGTIRIVDAQSGELVRAIKTVGGICSPTFSPDGTRVAAAGCTFDANVVGVWDVGTGRRMLTMDGEGSFPAYSPDGHRLATSRDGTIAVWDAESGRELLTMDGHTGGIIGLAFSADGTRLASGGLDGTARVWDATTGAQVLVLVGHTGLVGDVDFSPDGSRLLTGGGDGTARVWDVSRAGGSEWFTGVEPEDWLNSVVYSGDGSTVLTTGWNGGWLWDASTGERVQNYPKLFFDGALVSGESQIVGAGRSDVGSGWGARLLDAASGEEVRTLLAPRLSTIAASPDGSQIAIGLDTGIAELWDSSLGKRLRTLGVRSEETDDLLVGLAFSPDSRLLAGITESAQLRLWNVSTGEELVNLQAHAGLASFAARSLAFSPDGSMLATSAGDGVAIWGVPSGDRVAALTGPGKVNGVAFSPDGSELATAGDDGAARIWDTRTWQLTLTIGGRAPAVRGVAFSPDGSRLATVGADGLLRAYALDISDLVRLARDRVTRRLNDLECRQYLHVSSCPASVGTPAFSPAGPAPEELPLDGLEGAYRVTVSPDDLRLHGLSAKDAGDYTLSLAGGDWRLHEALLNGEAVDLSGTYSVTGDSITFTDRSDVRCFETTWSSRWSLDGNSLSFTDTSSTTNPLCAPPDIADARVHVTYASHPWQRVSHHEFS